MEKERSLLDYYLNGLTLTNRSLKIYLLTIALTSPTLLPSLLSNSPLSEILSLLFVPFAIINLGFSLSIPVFLLYRQQNRSLDFQTIISTTIQNTKRIILPGILIFILFALLLISSFIITAVLLHPSKEQVTQFFQSLSQLNNGWHPAIFILSIIFSFFVFTSLLFSLEHKGLLDSIKDSFMISFQHLRYLSLVIITGMISYSITSFLPTEETWGLFARNAISLYITLAVTASTLFYYQKNIKGESDFQ